MDDDSPSVADDDVFDEAHEFFTAPTLRGHGAQKRFSAIYREHPDFPTPPDDTMIWRYMSMSKFLSLLVSRSLHLTQCDHLDDPFEGTLPKSSTPEERHNAAMMRHLMYVNCWYMNAHESAAMWKLYSAAGDGIAVQSTIGRLKRCFVEAAGGETIELSTVRYIDYETSSIDTSNGIRAYFHKRLSFEHEREARVTFMGSGPRFEDLGGLAVDIVPETLIESIRLAPGSGAWAEEIVNDVAARYLSEPVPVIASALDARPMW